MLVRVDQLRHFINGSLQLAGQVSAQDWFDCTETFGSHKLPWAPFRARIDFDPNTSIGERMLVERRMGTSIRPSHILGVVKRDYRPNVGSGRGIFLRMSPADRYEIAEHLALLIGEHYQHQPDIPSMVTAMGSSHPFARLLAGLTAEALDVPFEELLIKPKDPKLYRYRKDIFDNEKTEMTPEARELFRGRLLKQEQKFARMLRNDETPTSEDFDTGTRRYYNLQAFSSDFSSFKNEYVLVIDDNAREGVTIRQLRKNLEVQGIDDIAFAVGYRLPLQSSVKERLKA